MGFIIVLHVIVCILLVISILMQSGRGGGLTETFQSAESMFGTQTNVFMVRGTTILAVIFFSTSLLLAFTSAKGDKSLMANQKLLSTLPKQAAALVNKNPDNDVQVKVEAPTPMAPIKAVSSSKEVPVGPVTNATQ